jgi:ribosomal protein L11 methyltransferase
MNLWQLRLESPKDSIPAFEEVLTPIATSMTFFEQEQSDLWLIDAYFEDLPDTKDLQQKTDHIFTSHNMATAEVKFSLVQNENWIEKTHENFPPLKIGRFYIHGQHVDAQISPSLIPLKIEAATAFGTGEHQTTRGCLMAFAWLTKRYRPQSVLDVGTGTGILAMAAAKYLKSKIIAVDLDPEAVRVTRINSVINQLHTLLAIGVSDGYNSNLVKKNAPYDLIFANILARPLCSMAVQLKENLKSGGYAILSGLLEQQKNQVIEAHRRSGLMLVKTIQVGEWSTLIIK